MKLFLLIASIAFGSQALQAGTVTLSSVGGTKFASKSGTLLPSGCAVRLGFFNLAAETRNQTVSSESDYAQLAASFNPLAEGIIGAGSSSQTAGSGTVLRQNNFPDAGDIFGSVSNISASYLAPGTQLYVWVFNHVDPNQATQWGIFTASTWVAPPALGNSTLSTTASMVALQGTLASGQLRLIDLPATFGNWTWHSFASGTPTALTQPNADADHDGLANFAEYAWQLNPAAASTPRTALARSAGGGATFTFLRPRNLPDVIVSAECSTDLRTWLPASSTVVSSDADFDTMQSTSAPGTRCFWRVRFDPAQ